jgi:hypothetical protein
VLHAGVPCITQDDGDSETEDDRDVPEDSEDGGGEAPETSGDGEQQALANVKARRRDGGAFVCLCVCPA